MSRLPQKCLIDTNVPKTANLAFVPDKISSELIGCVLACIEAVEYVVKKGGLVMDAGSDNPAEGLYLRFDQGDWLVQRAKLVRPAFIQPVEQHWSRSGIKPNRLRLEAL